MRKIRHSIRRSVSNKLIPQRKAVKLNWKRYKTYSNASEHEHCLYVFYYPNKDNRPFYIGKAKRFGNVPASRYNKGYAHLIEGLLINKVQLYIADLGAEQFHNAEGYEQELIALWNPIYNQKRIERKRLKVRTNKPWKWKTRVSKR